MSAVSRSRHAARVVLHGIARPHFRYPPLEDSWWYLPEVLRWQPWEPKIPPSRPARGLVGKLIVPSYVRFLIPPHIYLTSESISHFSLHLKQRTGDSWEINRDTIPEGYITAERLDATVQYTDSDGMTTHTLMLPSPSSKLVRRSFIPSLVRGLFRDEWSRKEPEEDDRTAGYPS